MLKVKEFIKIIARSFRNKGAISCGFAADP
jgi:hypothetical protein